jgi:hypothetical protein
MELFTIKKFAGNVMRNKQGLLYAYYFQRISETMKKFIAGEIESPLADAPSAIAAISGCSLPAAAFRERANGDFPLDSLLITGIFEKNLTKAFRDVINLDFGPIDTKKGIPVLIVYRGGAVVRHLDFDISAEGFEDFYSTLKADHQEDQINEMVEAFRAFMLIKDKSGL